ncbi:MAG: methionine ABC transporter permease [Peptococcaceae bacterium]
MQDTNIWNQVLLRAAEIAPPLAKATYETMLMVVIALSIAAVIGVPLGVLLVITRPGHIWEKPLFYKAANVIINMIRAIPFIILLFAIMPFTRFIAGTTIQLKGAVVPLVIFTAPFIARVTESALLEVNKGIIDAFLAMGASPGQIINKVLLKETRPTLILGFTISAISLIGASAMAGVVGGGGLGDLAIRYGYQRYEGDVMLATLVVLIIMVQGIQTFGNSLAKKLKK